MKKLKLSIFILTVCVSMVLTNTSLSFVTDDSAISSKTETIITNDLNLDLTDCFKLEFNLAGDLELINNCFSGGPGSSQCSVTGCSVTCNEGYYSCCSPALGCYCVSITEPGEA
ncbi:MAG: hypothetical protein ACFCU6_05230 [Balneolaceae bacterium]